jgi:hypothetical protein
LHPFLHLDPHGEEPGEARRLEPEARTVLSALHFQWHGYEVRRGSNPAPLFHPQRQACQARYDLKHAQHDGPNKRNRQGQEEFIEEKFNYHHAVPPAWQNPDNDRQFAATLSVLWRRRCCAGKSIDGSGQQVRDQETSLLQFVTCRLAGEDEFGKVGATSLPCRNRPSFDKDDSAGTANDAADRAAVKFSGAQDDLDGTQIEHWYPHDRLCWTSQTINDDSGNAENPWTDFGIHMSSFALWTQVLRQWSDSDICIPLRQAPEQMSESKDH